MHRYMHNFRAVCAIVMLAIAGAAMAELPSAKDAPLSLQATGTVVIETDGSVRSCTVEGPLSPQVKQVVENAIHRWKFEPVVRDGKPIAARASYSLSVKATRVENGYRLTVEDVAFRSPRTWARQPVTINTAHLTQGQDVAVLTAIRIDREGNLVDVAVLDVVDLNGGAVLNRPRWEERVASMLKKWKFEPASADLGDPDLLEGLLPIKFLGSGNDMANWRTPSFSGAKPVPWESGPLDASKLESGQLAFGKDTLTLREDVVGKAL